jgi:hypothetical protein
MGEFYQCTSSFPFLTITESKAKLLLMWLPCLLVKVNSLTNYTPLRIYAGHFGKSHRSFFWATQTLRPSLSVKNSQPLES